MSPKHLTKHTSTDPVQA